jgi:6-phosphogluconolactonase
MQIFEDRESASAYTAELISNTLIARLQTQERASCVVSGGSTPLVCLRMLSETELPWQRIDVTLTDERDVPATHPESNEKMARENLLTARAASARFIFLEQKAVARLTPFTTTLVGMGEDGHFASIFPNSPQLAEALKSDSELIKVSTPSSPYSRISMTLNALTQSEVIILLIFGDDKRRIIEAPENYPVNHLLTAAPIKIVWAP